MKVKLWERQISFKFFWAWWMHWAIGWLRWVIIVLSFPLLKTKYFPQIWWCWGKSEGVLGMSQFWWHQYSRSGLGTWGIIRIFLWCTRQASDSTPRTLAQRPRPAAALAPCPLACLASRLSPSLRETPFASFPTRAVGILEGDLEVRGDNRQ